MGDAIEALSAEQQVVIDLAGGFSAADWDRPSGCAGWSVKDVVSHMGALYWAVVDMSKLPDAGDRPTEEAQEFFVQHRRAMSAEEVLADYDAVKKPALDALTALRGADFELPLGDFGTYRTGLLANAYVFDHYTHIRADLFGPRGPLSGELPPTDELRASSVLDWVEAALSQQAGKTLDRLDRPASLELTGWGTRTIHVGPEGEPAAIVRCDCLSFVQWATLRLPWESLPVETVGDVEVLNVLRGLHLF